MSLFRGIRVENPPGQETRESTLNAWCDLGNMLVWKVLFFTTKSPHLHLLQVQVSHENKGESYTISGCFDPFSCLRAFVVPLSSNFTPSVLRTRWNEIQT
jgi:hypothetical protein